MFERKGRPFGLLLCCCLLAGLMSTAVLAATKKDEETRTPIDSVAINVKSFLEEGDDEGHVEVTSGDSRFSIGNTEWGTIPSDGWKTGDEPKVKIYLHAKSGYYFNKTSGSKKVTVNGATYKSAKRDDNDETLIITVELKGVQGDLEDPENVEWKGYPLGAAEWDKVEYATAYELKLYRDDIPVYSVDKSYGNSFDFYPYMTVAGTYKFRVRAIPKDSEEDEYMKESDWVYSDEMDITDDETAVAKYNDGISTGNNLHPGQIGWTEDREGWWYRNMDGSYPKNTWSEIDGKWYLFNKDGYMQTGWQNHNGSSYFLSDNGDMQKGWVQVNRDWYYMNPADGRMMTGWNESGGRWFYMDPGTGRMVTGWVISDGKWYYLDPQMDGAMRTNTTIGGYYLNGDGVWVP